jgi:hypothetical protein
VHASERNLPSLKTKVSFLLAGFPFSPDRVTNVLPSRELRAGTVLGDAAVPTVPGIASAPVAVTKIRTIAMVTDNVGERGAFIFGLPNQGKSSLFFKMWL